VQAAVRAWERAQEQAAAWEQQGEESEEQQQLQAFPRAWEQVRELLQP